MSKSMNLFAAEWQNQPSFRLMPITSDCPFVEAIFDRGNKVLVIFSKIKKDHITTLPRLNDDGEPEMAKKPKRNGLPYKEQRATVSVFQEYYLEAENGINEFIEQFAANTDKFDYKQFFKPFEAPSPVIKTSPTLVGENGLPLEK